ncbi:MAG: GumC family protein [Bryobacteraceae bacterium]
MLPTAPLSVSRRVPDLEDYIDIARRHRGWIMAPVLLGLVTAVVTAFLWPDTFVSTGTIRVVPPQVPERFVSTNVATNIDQRLQLMAMNIQSRGTLTYLITTLDLYKSRRSRDVMEDILEDMKKDIILAPPRAYANTRMATTSFVVGFRYHNRYTAQKVAGELARRLIDDNTRERLNQSQQTTQFLQEIQSNTKAELDAIEQKLANYRIVNKGRLPEHVQASMQSLAALENRVTMLNSNIARVNNEKVGLEAEIRGHQSQIRNLASAPDPVITAAGAMARNENLMKIERDIQGLERNLAVLLENYNPTFPDVRRTESQLAGLRKERDDLVRRLQQAPAEAPAQVAPNTALMAQRQREISAIETRINQLQASLQQKDLENAGYVKELAEVESKSRSYQRLLESTPIGDENYENMLRDRDFLKRRQDEYNQKVGISEIGTELEQRRQSELLEILDSPVLPEKASEPNRPLIISMGAVVGLMLGMALAAGRELKDTSLKNLKDVRAYTQLTILGCVPMLENDLVVRRRRRLAWLAWSTGCLLAIIVMSGAVYYWFSNQV